MRKLTVAAAMTGTLIEWYDVFIFTSGAVYVGEELFPSTNRLAAVLGVLLVFALGFVTRPVGALLFGHYGDLKGRRYSLVFTLVLSGVSSGLIGILPTYREAGAVTIGLLVLLRLILGLGLGGSGEGQFSSPWRRRGRGGLSTALSFSRPWESG
ncbi:hypothetical protein GCM10007116_07710 [Sulfodiicoccus acidiphilus]|uniref:Major facilitator superfamily (MFS) profile domain-containing protein n=1 Tax=Sulfodiicoccus acidiphilus TaxID=1670455 RepID=A0A830H0C5_9CREN|nr:MFS transporter [Sulfodiicoccus acidiphilus]GGT92431.1 hypothetical protein GCM10007116_07710 [Sulfodiicoccus acidiphilus]